LDAISISKVSFFALFSLVTAGQPDSQTAEKAPARLSLVPNILEHDAAFEVPNRRHYESFRFHLIFGACFLEIFGNEKGPNGFGP
jgi:hypothetical protein